MAHTAFLWTSARLMSDIKRKHGPSENLVEYGNGTKLNVCEEFG